MAVALAACGAAVAADGAAPVDEPWALHGHDLGGQRHSPLARINAANVDKLVPKWTFHSGVSATFQATPIVADGVMFVSLPFSHVVALDAATGREQWRYQHVLRSKQLCCGPASRGVAVAGGKVYLGSVDGRLIALDQKSGALLWDVSVAEYAGRTEATAQLGADDSMSKVGASGSTGVGIGAAPLVHDGRVYIGITGVGYGLHPDQGLAVVGVSGQYGRPGLMAAFDAQTGKALWRFDITGPGWEGPYRDATPDGLSTHRNIADEKARAAAHADAWKFGGGAIYATPVIDAERHLLIFGTGNPSPNMADASRPGDNLYTSSLVALDLRSGKLQWYHQQIPHDRWGYDVASPPVLFDLTWNGSKVPALASPSKLGWVYVHDRRDGRFLYKSDAFVPQRNMFTPPQPGEGVLVAPGIAGGANWSPSSYDASLGLIFVPASHLPTRYIAHEVTRPDGSVLQYASTQNGDEKSGTLTALDLGHAGHLRWQLKTDEPLIGGVLSTAGGLLFSGIGQGVFAAFDSSTGQRLWSQPCDAGVNAPPITYTVGGQQFVAVAAGGNSLFGFKTGDSVVVFGLPDEPGK
ncbi:MAG: PQQ-binding-like beta-propeller repeat protein [Pseudomonadota bacterium]|nr:PQQ-binding-like beta-propeller repeat protein [Pseudomonadota bacterium]